METIKIEIPKGYKVDTFNQETGEIKFKPAPRPVKERIKTIADVLADLGNNDEDVKIYRESMEVFGREHHLTNYQLAICTAKALNEGWTPDWTDSNYKYYPWFEMRGSSGFRFSGCAYWHSYSYVGSRLCFKSAELAKYAGTTFIEVYKKFMTTE